MIWIAAALAGGIGAYGEISPGAAWTDDTGSLIRAGTIRTNFGVFWGPYRSTLQYGRYHRLGLQWGAARTGPQVQGPLAATFGFGPEYGRGIDMLKVGVYYKVSLNAAYFVLGDPNSPTPPRTTLGVSARLTGGIMYWLTRHIGIIARVEGGPDVRGIRGISFGSGAGIGIITRVGFLTRQRKLDAEWNFGDDDDRFDSDDPNERQ